MERRPLVLDSAGITLELPVGDTLPVSDKEPALGNPASDGQVLSSTVAGVRSWEAATVGWGNITGTLASQLDLQAALNAKAALVHTHVSADITDLSAGGAPSSSIVTATWFGGF